MKSALALVIALFTLPAAAHDGHGVAGALLAAAVHPLTGLDHLAGMLAIGLWSRQQKLPTWLALSFVVTMAGGAFGVGLLGWSGAGELALVAGVALLGWLLASGAQVRAVAVVGLVAVLALLHGLAHGNELAAPASATGYLLTSTLLVLAGRLVATDLLLRRCGMALGAVGLCLLAGVA
ncbi:MAG: HupE/UreJ family protein [Pseudomonadota bacterium]